MTEIENKTRNPVNTLICITTAVLVLGGVFISTCDCGEMGCTVEQTDSSTDYFAKTRVYDPLNEETAKVF